MKAIDAPELGKQHREEDWLNIRIADFMRRYRPSDPYEARDFEAELIGLIRETHLQATRPFQKRLEAYENAMLNSAMLKPLGNVK